MDLGLERVRAAASALGDPHERLAVIHVAGTNGKGSTAAMLERIASLSGLRAGLYTSPHLSRFAERIRIEGEPISDERFRAALARVFADATDELTFFETLTLAAFVAFDEAALDVVILEVGLGGRLDATNLSSAPRATAIVSIARGLAGAHLEHANLLGHDVASIAREKAGIAKPGAPLVLGPLDPEARAAVLDVAKLVAASPIFEVPVVGAASDARAQSLALDRETGTFELPDGERIVLAPSLAGAHQMENAAVAAATAAVAGLGIPADAITRGVATSTWPGRLERIDHEGRVFILDCAHNIDGARALFAALAPTLDSSRTLLVFGALGDKAYVPMLECLAPLATRRLYLPPEGRAPAPVHALVAVADGLVEPSIGRATERALSLTKRGETVVVAGSIYLVGAVRAQLLGIAPDPVVAL